MKVSLLVVVGLVLTTLYALISTPFVWLAWNHGVVPALGVAHDVSVFQAFCLALLVSTAGSMFKSTLNVESKAV